MKIAGIQQLSLLDYPGKVSCIIFTQGCNFWCSYCHNSCLIGDAPGTMSVEEVYDFLKTRVSKLDGVVISGGEPTCQNDLESFIASIKELGYCVKLDTNGSNPAVIESLLKKQLIDYLAVDIKADRPLYASVAGARASFDTAKECLQLAETYQIQYEARTTVMRNFHTASTFYNIGRELRGCQHYYLQPFKDSANVPDHNIEPPDYVELQLYESVLSKYVNNVGIRGV